MPAVVSPIAELRRQIETAAGDPGLAPAERVARLRRLSEHLDDLRGSAATYIEDAEREREALAAQEVDDVALLRENADIRDEMIRRGHATGEECDALGMWSHERLDELEEDGELEEAAFGLAANFRESLVRRARTGRFMEKPGDLEKILKTKRRPGAPSPTKVIAQERKLGRDKKFNVHKTPTPRPKHTEHSFKSEGAIPDNMSAAQYAEMRRRERESGDAGKSRGQRTAEFEDRIRANLTTKAEVDFNERGRISHENLLQYVRDARTQPTTTEQYSTVNEDGSVTYDSSREELHDWIIDRLLRRRRVDENGNEVTCGTCDEMPSQAEPKFLMLGGGYGAGKSTTRKILEARGDAPEDSVVVNYDDIKALLPEFQFLTNEGNPEANINVYEESMHIGQRLLERATDKRQNVILDGLNNTSADNVAERARALQAKGYSGRAVYVTLPPEEAGRRVQSRASKAIESGNFTDARHVPEVMAAASHRDVAAMLPDLLNKSEELDLPVEVYDNNQGVDEGGARRGPALVAATDPAKVKSAGVASSAPVLDVYDRDLWGNVLERGDTPIEGVDAGPTDEEELRAALAHAEEIGLNDWPVPSDDKPSGEIFRPLLEQGLTGVDVGTHRLYGDGEGGYNKDRYLQVQRPIIEEAFTDADGNPMVEFQYDEDGMITGVTPLVETDDPPRMLFMAGGTASGKSSALDMDENADVVPPNSITIDPDHYKAQMPEYQEMMGERETVTRTNPVTGEQYTTDVPIDPDRFAANGVHEESSDISKTIQSLAQAAGMNVVVDGTGNSAPAQRGEDGSIAEPGKFASKMTKAKDAGYQVEAFYVNAPTDVAVVDATRRAMDTGRWVPGPALRDTHANVSANVPEIVSLAEQGVVSKMKFYDRSSGTMQQIAAFDPEQGRLVVMDQVAYEAMLAKKDEI